MQTIDYVGQQFGHYRLTQLLGKGGFGQVYLGEHIHLPQQRAIKILPIDASNPQLVQEDIENFTNEAKIMARLLHPHIMRVYDFGIEANNIPYLVMDYAPNGALLFASGTQLSPTDILPFVKQIADALHYLHTQQPPIIHRDIKPENLLLGPNNEVWLSDFGIAITSHYSQKQSQFWSGDYTSPEQLKGRPCPASDQYSLAIVIYEWLYGSTPFSENIPAILAAPPPSLVAQVPAIPLEVEQVVFTALAKDPQQRYLTMRDFVVAFETACQNSSAATVFSPRPGAKRRSSLPTTKLPPITNILPTVPVVIIPRAGTLLYTYRCHSNFVYSAAWSPDGARIASGGDDRTVHIWDALTGDHVFIYRQQNRAMRNVRWSPDGLSLASASVNQVIQLWNAASGKTSVTYREHKPSAFGLFCSLAWSPDGKRIASGGADKTVQVWNTTTGDRIFNYSGHVQEITAVAWSPDGKRIVSGSEDMTVQVWDADTGDDPFTYWSHTKRVRAVAWSPDCQSLASGSEDATVHVWNAGTGNRSCTYQGHDKRVRTVAWSPDGKVIASAGDGGIVHIWDAATASLIFTCEGHEAGVNAVSWSPDGQYLATASSDFTVRVWQAS